MSGKSRRVQINAPEVYDLAEICEHTGESFTAVIKRLIHAEHHHLFQEDTSPLEADKELSNGKKPYRIKE